MLTLAERTAACPKHMVFGPCGGEGADGACEVPGRRCSFADAPIAPWHRGALAVDGPDRLPDLRGTTGRVPAAVALADRIRVEEWIVTADLPSVAGEPHASAVGAAQLAPFVTALVTDDPVAGGGLAPAHRAALLREGGAGVIAGLTCRDRNRVALEGELAALAHADVHAVLVMTGDHPAAARAGGAAVFDLDSPRLAALAHRAGHLVGAVETVGRGAIERRVARAALKAAAGAEVFFVQEVAPGALDAFARAWRTHPSTRPWIAVLPVSPAGGDVGARAEAVASLPGVTGVHLALPRTPVRDPALAIDRLADAATRAWQVRA